MKIATVGAAGSFSAEIPRFVNVLEYIRTPSHLEDMHRWAREVAPAIKALGGHIDDAYGRDVLAYLELANDADKNVCKQTRQWRRRNWANIWRGLSRVMLSRALGIHHVYGALIGEAWDGADQSLERSLMSLRVVTNAGVAALTNAFLNTFEAETFNFHGTGTGGTAEAASQTGLVTELTTQLSPANTRPTGTQTAPSANVYQTVATVTYSASQAVTEHGIFTQASTAGGTMLDRSLFSVVNATSFVPTYQYTQTSGG